MAKIRPFPPVEVVGKVVSTIYANISDPSNSQINRDTGANILRHWRLFCEFVMKRDGIEISWSGERGRLKWLKAPKKKKSPEEHFSSLVLDSEGTVFAEYLRARSENVKPATISNRDIFSAGLHTNSESKRRNGLSSGEFD